uniref:Uncharacterized protein n=1 Tax=Vannella robusta TaxID=1487602 RepID=A0A7S4IPK0_9EUKA|mmetsp:Transcript_6394/g.7861  ORF Transcript_6394/g.7861 Transcript_6394/m.7861 type:complete len:203 (+) Transcript_6394:157-765(+)
MTIETILPTPPSQQHIPEEPKLCRNESPKLFHVRYMDSIDDTPICQATMKIALFSKTKELAELVFDHFQKHNREFDLKDRNEGISWHVVADFTILETNPTDKSLLDSIAMVWEVVTDTGDERAPSTRISVPSDVRYGAIAMTQATSYKTPNQQWKKGDSTIYKLVYVAVPQYRLLQKWNHLASVTANIHQYTRANINSLLSQ